MGGAFLILISMILIQPSDFTGQYGLASSDSIAGDPVIQSYIDAQEKRTLYKLLGKELADLLIAYIATGITVGPLVIGLQYVIVDYNPGDNFINVGASANKTGIVFTATGTTPTTYTKGSTLRVVVQRYEDLINPFYLEGESIGECFCREHFYDSLGIKDLLLIQVYYEYLYQEQIITSQSGVISQATENGAVQPPSNALRKGEMKWNVSGLDTWWAIRWFCKYKYPDIYTEYKGVNERVRSSSIL